jgi:hypothetical protein
MAADDSVGSIRIELSAFTKNLASLVDICYTCQNFYCFCRTGKVHSLKCEEKFVTPRVSERQIGKPVNSYCDINKEFLGALLQANK